MRSTPQSQRQRRLVRPGKDSLILPTGLVLKCGRTDCAGGIDGHTFLNCIGYCHPRQRVRSLIF